MGLPNVVTFSLAASSATSLVNAQGILGTGLAFTQGTTIVDAVQRRLLITTTGDESANTFTVRGLNGSGFPIVENITGPNASTVQTVLDFQIVSSIVPLKQTAATTSVGTNGVGSCPWIIMNSAVTPVNIEAAVVVVSSATAVTYTVQYTYDDPNNLPSGVQYPAAFSHPTLANLSTSLDGPINDPIFAARFRIDAGTGTIRGTFTQAGISGP